MFGKTMEDLGVDANVSDTHPWTWQSDFVASLRICSLIVIDINYFTSRSGEWDLERDRDESLCLTRCSATWLFPWVSKA